MQNHWRKFKKDKYYLLKYFSVSFIIFAGILAIQLGLIDPEKYQNIQITWHGLLFLPFGLILGVQVPVLIHNCVHGNLRPPLLNKIAGEIAGVYVLLGMAAFEINHRMHHVHSDSHLDPHNPHKRGFIGFFFANNFGGTKPVLKKFLDYHGDTSANRNLFKLIVFMHFIGVPMRLAFWIMLLGPDLFVTAFIPSYLFHMFVFAHINYVTHETLDNGEVEIYNLNSNIYYKFVNFFGSGVYFHKNHHINPNFYNPRSGASKSWLVR